MAIPFFIIAVILFAAAYQNQLGYLAQNASEDIKGFSKWAVAMIAIGVVGLIPKMRPVSNALYFLVILVLLIKNKGILDNIKSGAAFKPVSPPKATAALGSKANEVAAGPGVTKTGSLAADGTATPAGTGSAVGGVGVGSGNISNVIKFPGLEGIQAFGSAVSNLTSAPLSFSIE